LPAFVVRLGDHQVDEHHEQHTRGEGVDARPDLTAATEART